ncbi:MAG: zinc dependent phospholipase C family protein [Deltaproteobacteria bacterium]|nr:zinc dependent phospholipase C family protein [Deltaproteobacteria bacterium]
MPIFYLIIIFTAIFLLPERAFAWGPATHLELGWDIINHLKLITPSVRVLLERFPYDYLYGNIGADIIVGKNLVEELRHCHNWRIGLKVLKRAESDSQRAFAYGYLSHLAADTLAHNHYIPERMILSFSTRILRHAYWELRFDVLADKQVWRLPRKIARKVHRDNDRLLRGILEDIPLPFRTSKTIFNSFLLLHRMNQWHRMMGILSSGSRWALSKEDKQRYHHLSMKATLDLLNHGDKARCLQDDPTGRTRLNSANSVRKRLKTIKRQGGPWEDVMKDLLQKMASNL